MKYLRKKDFQKSIAIIVLMALIYLMWISQQEVDNGNYKFGLTALISFHAIYFIGALGYAIYRTAKIIRCRIKRIERFTDYCEIKDDESGEKCLRQCEDCKDLESFHLD